jgi:hypothetical protein
VKNTNCLFAVGSKNYQKTEEIPVFEPDRNNNHYEMSDTWNGRHDCEEVLHQQKRKQNKKTLREVAQQINFSCSCSFYFNLYNLASKSNDVEKHYQSNRIKNFGQVLFLE